MRAVAFYALVLALAFAGGAAAQEAVGHANAGKLPVPLLQPGKPVRATGKEPVTVYALEGGAGLQIRLGLKLSGAGGLVLHAPDGSQMLESLGAGELELSAFLPRDELYYVSVLRDQASQPFSLKLDVTEPDLHLAVFASDIGYSSQETDTRTGQTYEVKSCWIEPGLKRRRIYPFGVEESSLGRGGREFGSWKLKSGSAGVVERQVVFADGQATYTFPDGSQADQAVAVEDMLVVDAQDKFHRYLCTAEDG